MLGAFAEAGYRVGTCAGEYNESYAKELKGRGYEYFPVDLSRRGTSLRADWQYYQQLKGVIRRFRPDVVFAYTMKPCIYGSLAAARCEVPCIVTMVSGLGAVADTPPGLSWARRMKADAVSRVGRWLYRRALKRADVVYFQNPDDEAFFRRHELITSSRVVQTPGSGIDLKHYPSSVPPTGKVGFLLIARLLPEKGIREYVAASEQLQKEGRNALCVLVGPLEAGRAISAGEVDGWHRRGLVHYVGPIHDVRPYLEQASVYVLPSYYGEGQPRTILEALATGRPVITADSPGCRETVRDGENGYLVPPRDAKALADAMCRFIDHPEQIEQMGRRSREVAEQVYDVDKVNQIILDSIKQARTGISLA